MNNNGYQPPPGPYGYNQPPQQGYAQQPYYAPPPVQVVVQQNNATMVVKAPFSHGKHLIVDLLTCGAWAPVHLLLWILH